MVVVVDNELPGAEEVMVIQDLVTIGLARIAVLCCLYNNTRRCGSSSRDLYFRSHLDNTEVLGTGVLATLSLTL